MELAGADRFVTMDLHAQQVQGFFKKPMDHLYAMPMLIEIVRSMDLDNAVVVSPDAGFAKQARKYANALGLPIAIGDKSAWITPKTRRFWKSSATWRARIAWWWTISPFSGGTLVNLADSLKKHGCKRVFALLSHNIISARGVSKIEASPIEAVFSTDTVDNPNIIGHPKFKTISVAPMFAETIMRFYNYESISSMFSQLPESIVRAGFELADLKL